jgi:hypothetical protein
MNCQQFQKRMLESLAASEAQLGREVAAHQQWCPICRAYYEMQSRLFRSMDAGLEAVANEQIPPSLIPAVRVRLQEQPLLEHAWLPSWSFVPVAAVAMLAVGFSYVRHRPESQSRFSQSASVTSGSVANPERPAPPSEKSVNARPRQKRNLASSTTLSPTASEAVPEVIVLTEERQAFARFVAELPRERDVALALTRPAPVVQDDPVEIALMQIDSLDVKPLESSTRE